MNEYHTKKIYADGRQEKINGWTRTSLGVVVALAAYTLNDVVLGYATDTDGVVQQKGGGFMPISTFKAKHAHPEDKTPTRTT
jgi:hypothetical protein